jgi:hypothetical protein
MPTKLTATKIRQMLFNNKDLYAVIGTEEMTNSDARRYMFDLDYDIEFNVVENGTHLLIY